MSNYPGMMLPTQKGYESGAGNPRDSAIQSMNNKAQLQSQANNSLSGGKLRIQKNKSKSFTPLNIYNGTAKGVPQNTKRQPSPINYRFKGGVSNSTIVVPQYQMLYEPQGGPGTNPNSQIQGNSQTSTQMAANSALDNGAIKMGGRGKRSRKGGNSDWLWGCMSGGKGCISSCKKCSKKRRTYNPKKHKKSCKARPCRKH